MEKLLSFLLRVYYLIFKKIKKSTSHSKYSFHFISIAFR